MIEKIFLGYSIDQLRQLSGRIGTCLETLNEEQIWARTGDHENAIGNLTLHLCGNVRQWIIAGIGGEPDVRERDKEFSARGGVPAAALAQGLREVVDRAVAVLEGITPERLAERVVVMGQNVTVMEAVYRVVAHFSGHTGQIVFATKMLTGAPLRARQ